jgi:LysM repeat protein
VSDPGSSATRFPEPEPDPRAGDRAGEAPFREPVRASHSEQSVPLGGVPRALREAAELAGLDPVAELFNEALRYAHDGHLRLARERLQMLLCMAPDDGDARLMLARVHVAGQRWSDALAALDEATACGVDVPMSLRRAVEDHLRAERLMTEEQQKALRVREEGEVKALRQEARRLRSDHAQLTAQIGVLEREVRKWAWATASVSALACLFIAGSLVLGHRDRGEAPAGPEVAAADVVAPAPAAEPAPGAAPADVAPAPEPAPDLDALVRQALSGPDDASLTAKIDRDRIVVTGEVVSFRQRKAAEKALAALPGVASVDVSGVSLLVKTRGATHVVAAGDTLSHLAYAYYGDSSQTEPIERANHLDGQVLRIGQKLTIPPVQ